MDLTEYCRERVLVPGAPLTVFEHFLDRDYTARLIPLRAMLDKIATVPDEVSELAVGQAKLAWWLEEIARLQQGEPRHPAARAVQDSGAMAGIVPEILTNLAQALVMQPDPFETTGQLLAHGQRVGGAVARLEAALGGGDEPCTQAFASLGAARYLAGRLRRIPLDRKRGIRWLPLDLQARFQISTSNQPAGTQQSEAWQGLIRELCQLARQESRAGRAELQPGLGAALPYLRIQHSLDERWLERVEARPEQLAGRPLQLGRFNMLLIAWREARRARKELAGFDHAKS